MAKSTFHSTKIEKKNLLDKLKSAPSHADVEMAIRVVEDAKLIHEMHAHRKMALNNQNATFGKTWRFVCCI